MNPTIKSASFPLTLTAFAAVLLMAFSARAEDKPFNFTVGDNGNLSIVDGNGVKVAEVAPATIGKVVDAPPFSFLVSFGQDGNEHISIIVTPNPDNPTAVTFTIDGHSVQMDTTSMVTVTLGDHGKSALSIDPGVVGIVSIDGKKTFATASLAGGSTTTSATSGTTGTSASTTSGASGSTAATATASTGNSSSSTTEAATAAANNSQQPPTAGQGTNQPPDTSTPAQVASNQNPNGNPAGSLPPPFVNPIAPPYSAGQVSNFNPNAVIVPTVPPGTSPS